MRVFDTVYVPTGARSVEYVFDAATTNNTSNSALLDDAFLGVIPQGQGVDQGVRTSPDNLPQRRRLAGLRSPRRCSTSTGRTRCRISLPGTPMARRPGSPVSIQVWQEGANGPQYLATIAASTPDTGEYAWSPSQSGITARHPRPAHPDRQRRQPDDLRHVDRTVHGSGGRLHLLRRRPPARTATTACRPRRRCRTPSICSASTTSRRARSSISRPAAIR